MSNGMAVIVARMISECEAFLAFYAEIAPEDRAIKPTKGICKRPASALMTTWPGW